MFSDGTKETESDKLVDRNMRSSYGNILKMSEDLARSVDNVYKPNRETSNYKLFNLIEGIAGKKKQLELDEDNSDKSKVLEKIYYKYIAKRPMNYSLTDVRDYMFTGVDTLMQSSAPQGNATDAEKPKDSGISKEISEIYLRLSVIDKENYEKTTRAQCKWKDDVLKNELQYLLEMNSMAYVNPFRDYALAEEYIEQAKNKGENEKNVVDEKPKKGGKRPRSRRLRTKPLRHTYCKK